MVGQFCVIVYTQQDGEGRPKFSYLVKNWFEGSMHLDRCDNLPFGPQFIVAIDFVFPVVEGLYHHESEIQ